MERNVSILLLSVALLILLFSGTKEELAWYDRIRKLYLCHEWAHVFAT